MRSVQMDNLKNLIDKYYAWLKDKTVLNHIDDVAEITTPYLDRHNDYIQIYALKDRDKYKLTDDGYTIKDLQISGCSLDSPKRKKLLNAILNGYGVELEGGDTLTTTTT